MVIQLTACQNALKIQFRLQSLFGLEKNTVFYQTVETKFTQNTFTVKT